MNSRQRRRDEQVVIAQRLRVEGGGGEGLTLAAIAREMGISVSYASSLLSDPSGEKDRARKRKYLKRCQTCGALCHGDYCRDHANTGKPSKWTREAVIEAIQEWEIEHGRPPTCPEWSKRKGLPGWVPTVNIVYRIFGKGGWNKAIKAAGFTPRPAQPPEYTHEIKAPKPMAPEVREAMSEERRALYAENPEHPMFKGLQEGWDIGLMRRERRNRRFLARQTARQNR
jgi:hypothetical protein